MRLLIIILVLLFAVAGAAFGALNGDRVAYDFYFVTAQLPKGAMLLAALLSGWLIGGIVVYLGLVLRLRRRVRTLARELKSRESTVPITPDSTAPNA
ncbi:MAG: lipopolysaccharide assembly protein LapA domain-containing protein [Rudaea sp.]